jgi:hypothetical protein
MSFYLSQPPSSWLPACQNTNNDKFKNKWVYYRLWQSNQMFNLNFNTESISIIVSWHNGITHCLLISSTKKWAKIPNIIILPFTTIPDKSIVFWKKIWKSDFLFLLFLKEDHYPIFSLYWHYFYRISEINI